MKFLALYGAPVEEMQKWMKEMTPESQKASMAKWGEWVKSTKAVVDMGAPVGKNWRVTKDGASPMSNEIGGYSIIEAETPEEAVKVLQSGPHFDGGAKTYIELMPLMPM